MSTYDAGLTAGQLDKEDVRRIAEDELATSLALDASGGSDSTTATSGSPDTLYSDTVTMEADELLEVYFSVSCSHGTASAAITFDLMIDGTSYDQSNWVEHTGSSGGANTKITLVGVAKDLSGSITVAVEWYVSAGTGYSASNRVRAMIRKRRA